MAEEALRPNMSLEEYLTWEQAQATRYELIDGAAVAMAGATAAPTTSLPATPPAPSRAPFRSKAADAGPSARPLMVSQDAPVAEIYTRDPRGGWHLAQVEGLDAVLELEAIGVQLPLADVFRGALEPEVVEAYLPTP